MTHDNEVARTYRTGCANCTYANKAFDRVIANNVKYSDGKFVCCGHDLCTGIIPSTYDKYDKDVDDYLVMDTDNDSAGDIDSGSPEGVDSNSAEDIDNDSTRDIDNDSPEDVDNDSPEDVDSDSPEDIHSNSANVQSTTTAINRRKWTNQTVDETDNSSNISTSSWLTIVVMVIASSC